MRKSGNVSLQMLAFSLLLVLVASAAFLVDVLFPNPNIGFLCEQGEIPVRCRLYTAEYNAQVYFKTSGIYHRLAASGEPVFFLQLHNGSLIRLIFYCREGMLVTVRDQELAGGYEFCENVPFQEGVILSVDGTLITPSQLSSEFIGDLYVIELSVV